MYLLIESFMNGTIMMSQEFRLVQGDDFKQAVRKVKGLLFEYDEMNVEKSIKTKIKVLKNNEIEFSYHLKTENSPFDVYGSILNENIKFL